MAYQPKVTGAKIVSHNEKNGLFEVLVEMADRTQCRIFYETLDKGETAPTSINRLLKVPCPVCKKDYLCNCLTPHMGFISAQVSPFITPKK
jgi:hypothetical protein